MNYTRKTDPVLQPIDLDLAKMQCRIDADNSDQDAVLLLYIEAATALVEDYTGRSLMTQTWQASVCGFASRLWLPRAAPLQALTFIKYYDTSNVLQTLASTVYTIAAFSEPSRVTLVSGQTWPSLWDRDDAVQVEYVTGASAQSSVPAALRQAVQMLVGHFYANREATVVGTSATPMPVAAQDLCAPHRLFVRHPEWYAA